MPKYINYSMSSSNNNIENELYFKESLLIDGFKASRYSQMQRAKDKEKNNNI